MFQFGVFSSPLLLSLSLFMIQTRMLRSVPQCSPPLVANRKGTASQFGCQYLPIRLNTPPSRPRIVCYEFEQLRIHPRPATPRRYFHQTPHPDYAGYYIIYQYI